MTYDAYRMTLRLLNEFYRQRAMIEPDLFQIEDLQTSLETVWESLAVEESDLARKFDEELSSTDPDEHDDVMVRYLQAPKHVASA